MEVRGIEPRTSGMLSERSMIWATPTLIAHHFAVILHRSLRNGRDVRDSGGWIRDCEPVFELLWFLLSLLFKILICED